MPFILVVLILILAMSFPDDVYENRKKEAEYWEHIMGYAYEWGWCHGK